MRASATGTGFLDLPTEILVEIARHNYTDTATTRNVCLVAKRLTPIFQTVLLEHIETKTEKNNTLCRIIEHILSLALADPSPDPIETKIVRQASSIRSLKICRWTNSATLHWSTPLSHVGAPMVHYGRIIKAAGTFNSVQQQAWRDGLVIGKDSAILRLLLCFLSRLDTLELQGSVISLPRAAYFRQLRGGALQSLRKLRLCRLQENHNLTATCYHIMALPTLREVEFVSLSMETKALSRLPRGQLQITTLRFIQCYISLRAIQKLIAVCPHLAAFTYTLGRRVWPTSPSRDANAGELQQHLLTRAATLQKISFLNMQVARMDRIHVFGSLAAFTSLEYLRVNQLYLMPTDTTRSWITPHPQQHDAAHYLLTLPPSLRVLELYHCMPSDTIAALQRLVSRGRMHFPNLCVVKVRLRQLRASPTTLTQDMWDEIADLEHDFKSLGVTLKIAVVPSSYWQ